METKKCGADNQSTEDPCALTIEEKRFSLLNTTSDAPIPYDYGNAISWIIQILDNWDSFVTVDKILNF